VEIVRVRIQVEDCDGLIMSTSEIIIPKKLSTRFIDKLLFWKKDYQTTVEDAEICLNEIQEFINGNDS
jgi:hypothetical protein